MENSLLGRHLHQSSHIIPRQLSNTLDQNQHTRPKIQERGSGDLDFFIEVRGYVTLWRGRRGGFERFLLLVHTGLSRVFVMKPKLDPASIHHSTETLNGVCCRFAMLRAHNRTKMKICFYYLPIPNTNKYIFILF